MMPLINFLNHIKVHIHTTTHFMDIYICDKSIKIWTGKNYIPNNGCFWEEGGSQAYEGIVENSTLIAVFYCIY